LRKKIICIMCFLLVYSLLGCNFYSVKKNVKSGDEEKKTREEINKSSQPSMKTIALVMKTLTNPFFIDMEKGARKAEKEFGINLIVKTGAQETSIEQQIRIVEELINLKVDGIVIAPGSSTDLIPVLKKAQDAKIAIINVDDKLNSAMCKKIGLKDVPFVSVNNKQAAYLSAKYISDLINKPTEVALLEGIRTTSNSETRKEGALKAFKENKNIEVVAVETANWKIDEAFDVTSRIIKNNPNIGAIFCANDMMALGANEYIQSIGRKDIKVAGFDALEEVKEEIRKGTILVTVDQQAELQGYTGVKYVLSLINGNSIPIETIIPIKLIDKNEIK
jgi:ribose transport system substrate-binding protein